MKKLIAITLLAVTGSLFAGEKAEKKEAAKAETKKEAKAAEKPAPAAKDAKKK